MNVRWILAVALLLPSAARRTVLADDIWTVDRSSMTYHVTHPLHHVTGTSFEARGKGVCTDAGCEFLIAAPVKSFASSDSNRDLHMQQVTRAALHPIVSLRVLTPRLEPKDGEMAADLEVEFAGEKKTYPKVPVRLAESTDHSFVATATVPMKLSDFRIERPALLVVPVSDEAPVEVQVSWTKRQR